MLGALQQHSPNESTKRNSKKIWIVSVIVALLLTIAVSAALAVRSNLRQKDALAAQAKASYRDLANRLDGLQSAQTVIAAANTDASQRHQQYFVDMQAAEAAGQKRHDEGMGQDDTVRMHDLAQQEVQSVTDAQTQQQGVESDDASILYAYGKIYQDQVLKQFRLDLASRNEARENSLAEWLRAIDLINDNLTEALHSRSASNDETDIESRYNDSTRDANEAARYQKLVDADAQGLDNRLSGDIKSLKSEISELKTQHPDLASQKSP